MAQKFIWKPNEGAQQFAWERMDVKQLFFGGGRGCVHPDTLLDTPQGKVKIKDWKGGEIYSYKDGKVITTYATPPKMGTKEMLYEVKLHTGQKVTCTDQHKFYAVDIRATTGPDWVQLQDLTLSHLLITMSASDTVSMNTIKSISAPNIEEFYWDLHVPETNCYFAEGILHHNSGKTSWIIGVALTQWVMYGASARCLILRRQFRDLREIIRQGKEILCDTGLAKYNSQEHVFYGKGKFAGATLELGNLDRIDDYSRYHGNAYSMVGFDEITEFASWDLVDRMGSTCRSKDPKVIPIMRFTGNPGGRLHQEVKRRFYDPAPMGRRLLKTKDKILPGGKLVKGQTRMMVSSTVKDNPFLWENDPDYVTWLLSLPETLRKAWFEGCWDIAIGSFFGDLWNARDHVIPRVLPKHVPADWEIRRAFDWGSSTPFSLLWYTISNGDPMGNGMQIPRGSIVFLWEFYGQDPEGGLNVGMRWSSTRVAQEIAKREVEMGLDGRVIAGPADNQIYANTDGKDSNIYMNFEREGILFTRSNKSPGSARIGWEQIRTRLAGRDGWPLIYFSEDCVNAIRTLPELAKHPTKFDDIDDNQEDHCFTAGTMISMADGTRKPIEKVVAGDFIVNRSGGCRVLASALTGKNREIIKLKFLDGKSVWATPNHPFMVFVKGVSSEPIEVRADNLSEGDLLMTSKKEFVRFSGIDGRSTGDVYNITVEDDPTYFANDIFVHNCADVIKYTCLHHPINVQYQGLGGNDLITSPVSKIS